MEKNPCFKVENLPEDNERDRVLTLEEYEALKKELPSYLEPIVIVAYHTGLRKGDLLALKRSQVHLDGPYKFIEPDTKRARGKNKQCGEPPLTEEAVEALREAMKVRSLKYEEVFLYKGRPLKDVKDGFRNAVRRAGITDFRFHDLRHCAITNMRRAGLDPFTIMKFTGHKTLKMVERYNTVERVDGEEALEKLNTHFAAGKQRQEIYCKSTASAGEAVNAGK